MTPIDPPVAEPALPDEVAEPSGKKIVLIVEDDFHFSNLLALYLSREGYTPIQHYDGVGVVERARELKPTAITLDLMLPTQGGWDILRAIKSDPQTKDIPVLVISVLENSELALSLGATDYLVKPIHLADLRVLLDRLTSREPLFDKVKVLLVDDDPEMHQLLGAMLPDDWGTLLEADSGPQALTLARDEQPDVILLDLMMPNMSGFQILEKLRADARTADIPVIVLTAKNVTSMERSLLQEHIQGLMSKTALTPKSLLEELRKLESPRR